MFLHDAALVDGADIVSLCVRPGSLEKGQKIAEEYHIPKIETDYDAFLKNPEIETVYVGIANLVHYEYAKKALEAGKHVILEKPFTVTGAQARELAQIAKENQLFLWEAFIIPYLPAYETVKSSVAKAGNVKLVQTNYSKISSRYTQYLTGVILPAFDLSLAGGALYDLNIYNLHFTVGLFGKPKAAHYYPTKGYNGVDTSGIVVLEYDDFNAVCCAAKDSTSPSGFVIQGDAGTLRGEGSVSTLSKVIFADKSGETTLAEFDGKIKLSYELTEFIRQFEASDYDSCYKMLAHSVAVAEVVDECLS
jgi:predicted dehydrogenase